MMTDHASLVARMGRLAHFQGLSPVVLRDILATGHIRAVSGETHLCREGEPSAGIFVLISGEIQLRKTSIDGREHIMAVLHPVTMFNEVSVLDGGANAATAVTVGDCAIWQTTSARFNELLQQFPQIGLGLLPILAARNRWLVSQYEDLSFRTVQARTAKFLLDLSENGRLIIKRRQHPIHEIAGRIATVPEAVSRSLSNLDKLGLITCTRSEIKVESLAALTQLAQIPPDFPL